MRLLTGLSEVDALGARIAVKAPPVVASVADIPAGATVARISARTRDLDGLAARPGLRRVVAANLGDDELRHVARVPELDTLELTNLQCRSLGSLGECARLEVLAVSVSAKLVSLDGVAGLSRLRFLSGWHAAAVTSIDAIAGLGQLQVLHLAGAMYRPMRLPSLAPLASLEHLCMLTLSGVSVRDRSLRPLGGLTRLTRLELPLKFPSAEFEWLEGALPDARGQWKASWRGRARPKRA